MIKLERYNVSREVSTQAEADQLIVEGYSIVEEVATVDEVEEVTTVDEVEVPKGKGKKSTKKGDDNAGEGN
ncbi:MAG: hypothetical protein HG450_000895 [Clostridiales bacterium]|nr:hypothetical protein [Clostridiales bacterium]